MNDIQLMTRFRNEGWEIIGSGYKYPRKAIHEKINKNLHAEIIPWFTWLYVPSINYPDLFWLIQKDEIPDGLQKNWS